jgi:hypothetical protein
MFQAMSASGNQNGQSNGPIQNGGGDPAPMFSITPQIGAPGANFVMTTMANPASEVQPQLPVQPPLSDFLGQVK